jgi:HD-like signal output (HDOD) protein
MWELLSLDKINTMMSQDHLMYSFPPECTEDAFLHKLWKFSYYTAQISRLIAESEKLPEKTIGKAYVSGLLQAIGAVAIYEFNRQKRTSLSETEIMAVTGGNSYSAAGGYLLCLWGLHQNIFNVVRHQLNPGLAPHETDKNLLGIVHVAAALARSKVWPDMTSSITIDNAFLKGTGAHEKLQGWQNIARAV